MCVCVHVYIIVMYLYINMYLYISYDNPNFWSPPLYLWGSTQLMSDRLWTQHVVPVSTVLRFPYDVMCYWFVCDMMY